MLSVSLVSSFQFLRIRLIPLDFTPFSFVANAPRTSIQSALLTQFLFLVPSYGVHGDVWQLHALDAEHVGSHPALGARVQLVARVDRVGNEARAADDSTQPDDGVSVARIFGGIL